MVAVENHIEHELLRRPGFHPGASRDELRTHDHFEGVVHKFGQFTSFVARNANR